MKHRDLNAPPAQQMADIVRALKERAESSKTGAHGVKDLGASGDTVWVTPDGRVTSVREVDEGLEAARDRIDEASADLIVTQERLEAAETVVQETDERLGIMETVTLPGAVQALEEADRQASEALTELDARLTGVDGPTGDLSAIRESLAEAVSAVESAADVARTANEAANAASQAALEAAGIAAAKGRVIIQETEPVGEDRKASNIWIKPIPDDPKTGVVEKSVTYVFMEATGTWEPTTSSELAQAAQNALDAREAARQAQQRAETAISNAATAQSAAEAAQRTADQATLSARDAHNAAVAARESANSALAGAENKVQNASFEYDGTGSTAGLSSDYISTARARTGSRSFVTTGAASVVLGETVTVAPPSIWRFSAWIFIAPNTEYRGQLNGGLRLQYRKTSQDPWPTGMTVNVDVQDHNIGRWYPLEAELQIPAEVTQIRARMAFGYPQKVTIYVDDVSLIDVTDIVQLEASASAAQARADKAYSEAASKATPAQVAAAQKAATDAAAADAKAKADAAQAEATRLAALDAKAKADAAQAEATRIANTKATPAEVAAAKAAAEKAAKEAAALDATAKADAAKAAAAADAKAKADAALAAARADLATARTQITAEIKASANGKNAITVSTSAPTSSTPGVVAGDTWWRVDASGNIYGQWAWNSSAWVARTIRSEVIANLDVHKLQVTGTAKIPVAVIDKLFTETFVAHKITGTELSIASVKPDGSLANNSVTAVTIKDGAITTPKLTVTEDMSAAIVNAMSVNTKKLVVTEEALLNHATLIGQTVVDDINVQGKLIGKDGVFTGTVDFENVNVTGELLAQEVIAAGLTAGDPGGERLDIDPNGLTMWGIDPDGTEYEMVRIGPSGENLLTIGDTTIAPDSVASPRGAFGALEVGGEVLTDLLAAMPRGRVAQNRYLVNSDYSDRAQSRLGTQFTVMPGRRYRIEVSPFYLQANSQTTDVEYRLLYAWDSLTTTWDGPGVAQGRSPLGNLNPLLVPGLVADLPTTNATPREVFLTLMVRPARDAVRVVARDDYPLTITVDDVGARNSDVGSHWTVGNVTEGTTTPPPATPTIQEKSYTWSATGYGGDVSAGQIVQGTYPGVGERWGGWTFPSGMLSTLRAAKSIKRFEVYLYAEHWYYGAGGTAVLRPNDGSYKGTTFGGTAIESAKWPPKQGRWVTVPSSWHSPLMSNTYKGISVKQSSSSLVQYGRFNATATRFRATYTI